MATKEDLEVLLNNITTESGVDISESMEAFMGLLEEPGTVELLISEHKQPANPKFKVIAGFRILQMLEKHIDCYPPEFLTEILQYFTQYYCSLLKQKEFNMGELKNIRNIVFLLNYKLRHPLKYSFVTALFMKKLYKATKPDLSNYERNNFMLIRGSLNVIKGLEDSEKKYYFLNKIIGLHVFAFESHENDPEFPEMQPVLEDELQMIYRTIELRANNVITETMFYKIWGKARNLLFLSYCAIPDFDYEGLMGTGISATETETVINSFVCCISKRGIDEDSYEIIKNLFSYSLDLILREIQTDDGSINLFYRSEFSIPLQVIIRYLDAEQVLEIIKEFCEDEDKILPLVTLIPCVAQNADIIYSENKAMFYEMIDSIKDEEEHILYVTQVLNTLLEDYDTEIVDSFAGYGIELLKAFDEIDEELTIPVSNFIAAVTACHDFGEEAQELVSFLFEQMQREDGRLATTHIHTFFSIISGLIMNVSIGDDYFNLIKEKIEDVDYILLQFAFHLLTIRYNEENVAWFVDGVVSRCCELLSEYDGNEDYDFSDGSDENRLLVAIFHVLYEYIVQFPKQVPDKIFDLADMTLDLCHRKNPSVLQFEEIVNFYVIAKNLYEREIPTTIIAEYVNNTGNHKLIRKVISLCPELALQIYKEHGETQEAIIEFLITILHQQNNQSAKKIIIKILASLVTNENLECFGFIQSLPDFDPEAKPINYLPLINSLLINGQAGLEPIIDVIIQDLPNLKSHSYKIDYAIMLGIMHGTIEMEKIKEYIAAFISVERQDMLASVFDFLGVICICKEDSIPLFNDEIQSAKESYDAIEDEQTDLKVSYSIFAISAYPNIDLGDDLILALDMKIPAENSYLCFRKVKLILESNAANAEIVFKCLSFLQIHFESYIYNQKFNSVFRSDMELENEMIDFLIAISADTNLSSIFEQAVTSKMVLALLENHKL